MRRSPRPLGTTSRRNACTRIHSTAKAPLSESPHAEKTDAQALAGTARSDETHIDAPPRVETDAANWAGTDNAGVPGRPSFAAAGRRSGTADSRRSASGGPERGPSVTLKRRFTELLTPEKPVGKNPTFARSAMNFVKSNWLHIGWAFIPVRCVGCCYPEAMMLNLRGVSAGLYTLRKPPATLSSSSWPSWPSFRWQARQLFSREHYCLTDICFGHS